MSAALAVCASCDHVFSDDEALDPCPKCGGTERTLRREAVVVDRSEAGRVETQLQIEEQRPDGSCEVLRDPIELDG
jgi:Zn finger protein HypA/HybF involved in hydrogenase expression